MEKTIKIQVEQNGVIRSSYFSDDRKGNREAEAFVTAIRDEYMAQDWYLGWRDIQKTESLKARWSYSGSNPPAHVLNNWRKYSNQLYKLQSEQTKHRTANKLTEPEPLKVTITHIMYDDLIGEDLLK